MLYMHVKVACLEACCADTDSPPESAAAHDLPIVHPTIDLAVICHIFVSLGHLGLLGLNHSERNKGKKRGQIRGKFRGKVHKEQM